MPPGDFDDIDRDDRDDDRFEDRYSRRDDRRRRRYDDDYDDDDDYDFGRRRRWREPHRGTLILVLGIVGLAGGLIACLPVLCCPFAWFMGSNDLAKMRAGTMDYSGYGTTQAGYVLGIIGTLLFLAAIAFFCIVFGIVGAKGR
jgi:hypothetical protein